MKALRGLTGWAIAALASFAAPVLAHAPEHLPGGFHSPDLRQGDSWNWTFPQPGTYVYHCHPHPFMRGTVRVEASAPDPSNATVGIRDYTFQPGELRIRSGMEVRWRNDDNDTHTVTQSKPDDEGAGSTRKAPAAGAALGAVGLAAAAFACGRSRRLG